MHHNSFIFIYSIFQFSICVLSVIAAFILQLFFLPVWIIYAFVGVFVLGWSVIILDLLFSRSKKEEKFIWTIVLILLNGLILPFYWFIFLKRGKHSYIFEKLSNSERNAETRGGP